MAASRETLSFARGKLQSGWASVGLRALVVATVAIGGIAPARAEPGDAGDTGTSGPSALDALGGGLAFGGWSDSVPLELAAAPRGMVP
ncbi:MAG: hypothetical protein EXR71_17890 [Myxococcales bacterium]|nr:hypothetical protein [Myxococcales bacterium]